MRVPASYCGIFGIRPSHGVVDISGGIPMSQSFDTVGEYESGVSFTSLISLLISM